MKKLLVLLMATIMSVSIFAEKIGTVNTQEIFQSYSKTKAVQVKLEKEKTKLEGQLQVKAKKIEQVAQDLNAKGDKVTEAEKDKFQKQQEDFAKERQALQNKLGKMEYDEMSAIRKDIESAINQVAKKGKYDVIIQKGAVLYGGKDITAEVLKTLENSKKIAL